MQRKLSTALIAVLLAAGGMGAAQAQVEASEVRAQLRAKRFTTLGAEVPAKVQKLGATEGASFKAGDLLVQFDCTVQEAQLSRAEAASVAADRTLEANRRLEALNSVGKLELDLAQSEVEKAKADVSQLRAVVRKCRVTAPFDGVVAEQKVREQQFVQPGESLLEILDPNALELEFIVPSRWLSWLQAGSRFTIAVDEMHRSYTATVTRIGVRADPVSQTVKVVGELQGRQPGLRPGMSGRVAFAR